MKQFFKYLFRPSFWHMNYPYSEQVDVFISSAIDADKIELVDSYYCRIYGKLVWIENYPYAAGKIANCRPSRGTLEKLHAHLLKLQLQRHMAGNLIELTWAEKVSGALK